MVIDPRHLGTYLAVCRANSISEAARRMNISQPSVSVAISQLEYSLGARLFERGRSGIELTAAGVALQRRAEALETLLANAAREVSLIQVEVAGPLMVGGTPGALATLMPKAVSVFRQSFASFELQVVERPDTALVDMLRNERLDFALVTTGIEAVPDDLVEENILRDPFALIVGREHAHLPERVRLVDLSALPWVLPEAVGAFRRQVDALFIATGAPTPKNVIRCDSLLTTKAIVSDTDYVTILPHQVVAPELAMGVLRAIDIEGGFLRTVGVRRVAARHLPPMAAAFVEALRTAHAGRGDLRVAS